MLWLRSLVSGDARPLPGTDNAMAPFWSPDSASLGYFTSTALRRLDIKGGQSRVIVPTPSLNPAGASWSAEGTVLFAPTGTGPLMRVSDTGGEVTQVTKLDSAQLGHGGPQLLPDGRTFPVPGGRLSEPVGRLSGRLKGSAPVRLLDTSARIRLSAIRLDHLRAGWIAGCPATGRGQSQARGRTRHAGCRHCRFRNLVWTYFHFAKWPDCVPGRCQQDAATSVVVSC